MKVTCLSVLLLATSAAAYRNGCHVDGVGHGRNRGLKTGNKNMGMSKGIKGSKGSKGAKGMKDKGMKGKAGCQSLKIKAPYSEVEAGFGQTAVGETLTFPVYDFDTNELIGTYTDATTEVFVGGEFSDCTFAGSFNFDFDSSLDFPFVSQVMVSGSCLGASNSIVGGTGKYACAAGSEIFIDGGDDFFASDLVICNTCA
jgi:hypothetical protein